MDRIIFNAYSCWHGKPWTIQQKGIEIAYFTSKQKAQEYLTELQLRRQKT